MKPKDMIRTVERLLDKLSHEAQPRERVHFSPWLGLIAPNNGPSRFIASFAHVIGGRVNRTYAPKWRHCRTIPLGSGLL